MNRFEQSSGVIASDRFNSGSSIRCRSLGCRLASWSPFPCKNSQYSVLHNLKSWLAMGKRETNRVNTGVSTWEQPHAFWSYQSASHITSSNQIKMTTVSLKEAFLTELVCFVPVTDVGISFWWCPNWSPRHNFWTSEYLRILNEVFRVICVLGWVLRTRSHQI